MAKIRRMFSKFQHPTWLFRSRRPAAPPVPAPSETATDPILVPSTESARVGPPVSSSKPQLDAPLESLPPEIRRKILSILEIDGLRALVHASPTFHQQYLLDRRLLLCQCLGRTLRSVTVDACAVYRSGLPRFVDTSTKEKVAEFLTSYQGKRSSVDYSIATEGLSEDEAVAMTAFHSTTVQALARQYIDWALDSVAKETKNSPYQAPPSMTEDTRIMRALYRFQLLCNLFGRGGHGSTKEWLRPHLDFDTVSVLSIFFGIFEPWEVEEVVCIYAFAKDKYDQIFRDISWDVNPENPKFDNQPRPPTPEGAFEFDNTWSRGMLLEGTTSYGLELLHTVFFKTNDHAHLVSIMQERISWPKGDFFDGPMHQGAQWARREQQLSEKDLKQRRRDPLPFRGDTEPDANGSLPPLAWTLMWKETYSNLFGYYVDNDMRRWGYVMWDAARLESMGVKEVLARQWDEDFDPRDNLD